MTLIELRRSKDTQRRRGRARGGRFRGAIGRAVYFASDAIHPSGATVLECARRAARDADRPLLLAVSGGLDSMVLLDAFATVAPSRVAAVATFDHGTGAHATRAAGWSRARRAGEGSRW